MGLCIIAVGVGGLIAPTRLASVGDRFDSRGAWFAIGVVRLTLAALLLWVAAGSRAPRTLRVVACVPAIAGVGALATPLIGVDGAQDVVESWTQQGSGVLRLTTVPILILGGVLACGCMPRRRASSPNT